MTVLGVGRIRIPGSVDPRPGVKRIPLQHCSHILFRYQSTQLVNAQPYRQGTADPRTPTPTYCCKMTTVVRDSASAGAMAFGADAEAQKTSLFWVMQ